MSHLAAYFRRQRLARKLKPSQLARLAGYSNLGKQSINIETFEAVGWVHPEMLSRLAKALDIDPVIVLRLMQRDWTNFIDGWFVEMTTPIQPVLGFPFFMAVQQVRLPDTVRSLEQAEVFASAVSGERCHWAKLILSRRFYVQFGSNGEVTGYCEQMPSPWIWQKEQTETRPVSRERVASLFVWPAHPVEDEP